jgi:hypothetical protein
LAVLRKKYTDPDHEPNLKIRAKTSKVDGMDLDTLWDILELVVKYTPIPGTKGCMGEQIVPGTLTADDKAQFKRHLLDIPPEAGAIQPPVKFDMWALITIDHWATGTSQLQIGGDIVAPILKGVVQIIASIIPGAGTALSSVTAAVQEVLGVTAEVAAIIMKIASVVLKAVWQIVKLADSGRDINASDIIGLAGGVVDAVKIGVGDAIQEIPPGLWDNLKTVGAKLDEFGEWSSISGNLYNLQSALCNVRDRFGWDYLDEAFSGVGLSSNAKAAYQAAGGQ